MKKEFNFDSYWNYPYRYLIVEQKLPGIKMIVCSRHKSLKQAIKNIVKYSCRCKGLLCKSRYLHAILPLYGNTTTWYNIRDIVNPEDISFSTMKPYNTCSECCANCQISSLTYKCPVTAGNPLCDTVANILRISLQQV